MFSQKQIEDALGEAGIRSHNGRAVIRIPGGDQLFMDVSVADLALIGEYVAREAYKMGVTAGQEAIRKDLRCALGIDWIERLK